MFYLFYLLTVNGFILGLRDADKTFLLYLEYES